MATAAVLGSGNAACTYSAYLGKRGHEMHLYDSERFEENLTPIRERGGMDMVGADTGFGPIAMVTTNVEEAIKGVKVVFVVLPAFGHKTTAEAVAPYAEDGQIFLLNPGAMCGALEFYNTLRTCGCTKDIVVGELESNIFACRRIGPTTVDIFGKKHSMAISTIPADRVEETIRELEVFYPDQFIAKPNMFHTSLAYGNMIIHPAGSLLNMGRIEWTHGDYKFYWEGLTPGVCRNIEAVDQERRNIGEALGCQIESLLEASHRFYGHPERDSVYEFYRQSEVNDQPDRPSAPKDLSGRYITEDVPYGLVPMSELGKALGVETPVIDSLITVASVANETDYRTTGRTLKRLGLDCMNKEQILSRVISGK